MVNTEIVEDMDSFACKNPFVAYVVGNPAYEVGQVVLVVPFVLPLVNPDLNPD